MICFSQMASQALLHGSTTIDSTEKLMGASSIGRQAQIASENSSSRASPFESKSFTAVRRRRLPSQWQVTSRCHGRVANSSTRSVRRALAADSDTPSQETVILNMQCLTTRQPPQQTSPPRGVRACAALQVHLFGPPSIYSIWLAGTERRQLQEGLRTRARTGSANRPNSGHRDASMPMSSLDEPLFPPEYTSHRESLLLSRK